jgi:hypothetical protein
LKRKRERWTRAGAFWKKKGSRGVFWSKAIFFLLSRFRTERGGDWAAAGLEGGGAGGPAHGGGREAAQNREEAEGVLFSCSP